jgi:hypothetical protein
MTKQPMQADGGGEAKGAADGVSEQPGAETKGGESQGGAYPNPHNGKEGEGSFGGFMGHGGQSEIGYEGPDNPNATTKPD